MKYNRLFLSGFKPYNHASINTVDVREFTNIVLIASSNGVGKSMTLNQLSLFAPQSTIYKKNGQRILEISHNGSEYILDTDFGRKDKHRFIKDGVDLNDSGTSHVFNELVEREFGYTSLIDKMFRFQIEMSRITKSHRQQLLMTCNPVPLDFVLQKYKRVTSYIKGLKSQINLLVSREAELKDLLFKPEQYDELISKRDSAFAITNDVDNIKLIYTNAYEETRTQYEQANTEYKQHCPQQFDLEYVSTTVNKLRGRLKWLEGGNEKVKEMLQLIPFKIDALKLNITTNTLRATELAETIDSNELKLKQYSDTKYLEQQAQLESLIKYKDMETLNYNENYPVVIDVESMNNLCETIDDLTSRTNWLGLRYLAPKTLQKLQNKRAYLESKCTAMRLQGHDLISQHGHLAERFNTHIKSDPPIKCSISDCILRQLHQQTRRTIGDDYEKIKTRVNRFNSTMERYNNARLAVVKYHDGCVDGDTINDLYSKLQQQYVYFKDRDDFNTIQKALTNLNALRIYFRHILESTEAKRKIDETNKAIEIARINLKAMEAGDASAIKIIEENTIKDKVVLDGLTSVLVDLDTSLQELEKEKQFYSEQQQYREVLYTLKEQLDYYSKPLVLNRRLQFLKLVIDSCTDIKNEQGIILAEVTNIIKQQDKHTYVIESELQPNMKRLNTELEEFVLLEKALSPTKGLPYEHMLEYLNTLVNSVNYILSKVWQFELALVPFTKGDKLDYNFKVCIGEDTLIDIAHCSDGQRSIIDFAWCIAIMAVMKPKGDMPLVLDEIDRYLDSGHRQTLCELLEEVVHKKRIVNQIVIVNHFATTFDIFSDSSIICLNDDNILVPDNVNEYVTIT